MSTKNRTIVVKDTVVTVATRNERDYISLSDMVRNFDGQGALIEQWLRAKDTVLFLGVWEQLNNPAFNSLEFEGISAEAGRNSFFLSVKKWTEKTGAIGVYASAGRYGGTYAHRDIAFEFGSWLSPEFKLYLIKEFQRLKDGEAVRSSIEWNIQRTLAKVNYRIHTDAIREHLIPSTITKTQVSFLYASEADLLNVALFGRTAIDWRMENPKLSGNIRDHATLEQLVVLSNLESLNSILINQDIPAPERLRQLNAIAIVQMRSLLASEAVKRLPRENQEVAHSRHSSMTEKKESGND